METRTVEQVESWSTRSVADGYAGLRELSDGEFSGAVRASGAWLFMLNGRIIGVFEGSLDDFENADGTAYAAPHPSLPLLFSMQEQGGETQAKYYTNDTPLTEVDSTLTDGKFTGFIELSENVLSGDYYVAYYGGRSMSVAFVGASEQVVTGDDAFERAADEVGIYEVRDVNVEVIDVPEPEDDDEPSGTAIEEAESEPTDAESASDSSNAATASESESDTGTETTEPDATSESERSADGRSNRSSQATENTPTDEPSTSGGESGAETQSTPGNRSNSESESARRRTNSSASDDSPTRETGRTVDSERTADADGGTAVESTSTARTESSPDSAASSANSDSSTDQSGPGEQTRSAKRADAAETGDESSASSKEAEWRDSTTIPSLDPDLSESPDEPAGEAASSEADSGSHGASTAKTAERSRPDQSSSRSRQSGTQAGSGTESSAGGSSASESGSKSSSNAKARIRKLRKQLRQRKQQVEQLKDRLSTLESERNEYKRERDALRQEVERLEAKLEHSATGSSTGRELTATEAFDGTNLFVRYQSKGEATLAEAAKGQAERSDVSANLRLEHHTQFEADDVTVDREPFETFLTNSFEYEFVSWIIEDLLYEIRDTGHRNSLKNLYEAIPKIDRIDLHGSVNAGGDDASEESFDVIMRDRMGDPLVVADLNGSREPTTGELMGSLVEAASGVAQAYDALAGAFQVTESFFEPEALETAEAATSGGLLSREKRASFVKLSRKRGYHLCLVESRSDDFHLNVPEL